MRIPFKHIIVATDFGPISERALQAAEELASTSAARLTVVHVIENPVPAYAVEAAVLSTAAMIRDIERSAQEKLEKLLASVKERTPLCEGVLRRGRPADEIVAHAKEAAGDLVVVGTHGRQGASRWLLGSVAEKVVRTCPVPVVTVRGDVVKD